MDISKAKCPECGRPMTPAVCLCKGCNVRLEGEFEVSPLARLGSEDQALAIAFIRSFGSIKSLQESLGVSYPTARNRLEALVKKLDKAMAPPNSAGNDAEEPMTDDVLHGFDALRGMHEQMREGLEPLRGIGEQIREGLKPLKDMRGGLRKQVRRRVRKQVHVRLDDQDQPERARAAEDVLRRLEAGEIDVKQALEEL